MSLPGESLTEPATMAALYKSLRPSPLLAQKPSSLISTQSGDGKHHACRHAPEIGASHLPTDGASQPDQGVSEPELPTGNRRCRDKGGYSDLT
jgi:hypothetical protein